MPSTNDPSLEAILRKEPNHLYNLPEAAPPPLPKFDRRPFDRAYIKANMGKWATFRHPKIGMVVGKAIAIAPAGYTMKGHIPEYKGTMLGRSKTARNEIQIFLIDSYATFHASEQEAVDYLLNR